jgi:hypothetical protein
MVTRLAGQLVLRARLDLKGLLGMQGRSFLRVRRDPLGRGSVVVSNVFGSRVQPAISRASGVVLVLCVLRWSRRRDAGFDVAGADRDGCGLHDGRAETTRTSHPRPSSSKSDRRIES